MTFGMLLQILKSRAWLLVMLPVGAAVAAALFSLSMAPTYSANATVVLDYRRPVEGQLAGELLPVGLQASYLSTQIDIIKSRPVAEKVVTSLNLTESPVWKERFKSAGKDSRVSMRDWLLGTLSDSLQVLPGSENRLIDIWYQDPDPKIAAALANAFVDAYGQVNKRLDQNPAMETAKSVETVLATLRKSLEDAQNKVSSYQSSMGITATDERLDVETANLNELVRQRLLADASVRVAESRLNTAKEMVSQGPVTGAAGQVLGNDIIQNLQIALSRKEGEIAERATTLGERHPEMLQLKAERTSLQEQLVAETRKVVSGIQGDLLQARGLADSAARAETDQKNRLMELKHVRDGMQPLLRELESAQASYDRALQMYSEYAMHSNLNQANVSLLAPAQVPSLPSSPSLLRNVGTAFLAGLIFAFGVVALWELFDKRVRGKEEISDLGIAGYLGTLPKA
jgi:chain length determinant protein EpsF